MSGGLYSKAAVARWMGKRPQDIQKLIDQDGLPAVPVPTDTRLEDRIPLHGLHEWCRARSKGSAFMKVEQLAREMEMCREGPGAGTEAEIALLGEAATLSTAVRDNLVRGQESPHTWAALMQVVGELQHLKRTPAA